MHGSQRPSPCNFDGIPGPTHNYAGLARGNLAAERNADLVVQSAARRRCRASRRCARSRRAASRRRCCRRTSGRPSRALRALGFAGSDARGRRARRARRAAAARRLLVGGGDVGGQRRDGQRVAATRRTAACISRPPTSSTHFHRALEAPVTTRDPARAVRRRHALRRARSAARRAADSATKAPRTTRASTARTVAASSSSSTAARVRAAAPRPRAFPRGRRARRREAIARRHGLDPARARVRAAASRRHRCRRVPQRRDRGGRARRCWSATSARSSTAIACTTRCARASAPRFEAIVVRDDEVPLAEAVATYFFNSQLLARPDGRYTLVAPAECRRASARARAARPLPRGRRADRRGAGVRPAPEHAQRRRARRACGCACR